jgi:adenylate cyclase
MVDVLFSQQGTLDKFVGDEIIGLFGAPVAVPDAELRAVQCALEMQRVLKDFNRTRLAEGQDEIRVGIGINTGFVVTGAIGSSRALQYTAIGDAMNLASRLCSAAAADQILVSDATYRKIADRVAAVAMPPMRFKNKADEQKVFNIIGMRGSPIWRHETAPV